MAIYPQFIKNNKISNFSLNFKKRVPLIADSAAYPHISVFSNFSSEEFQEFFSLDYAYFEDRAISGQNYEKLYDVVFSGCSETTGRLLSDDDSYSESHHVWGKVVSKYYGVDSLNLAIGGASAMSILHDFRDYVNKNGPPKHFLVLFPRLDARIELFQDNLFLINDDNQNESYRPKVNSTRLGESTAKYSKAPHKAQDVLSGTYVNFLNVQSILTLETLCAALNINLIYSTWSTESAVLIEEANREALSRGKTIPFKNYIETSFNCLANDHKNAAEQMPTDCHLELSGHPQFYAGYDESHMGAHPHAHIGEEFVAELTKRGYTASL